MILTADDGYQDFYRVAYPLIKKQGLTATFFPTVHFIEGMWFWWDRLSYALHQTKKRRHQFDFAGRTFRLNLRSPASRERAWTQLADYCMGLDEPLKAPFVSQVEKELDVEVPLFPVEASKPASAMA